MLFAAFSSKLAIRMPRTHEHLPEVAAGEPLAAPFAVCSGVTAVATVREVSGTSLLSADSDWGDVETVGPLEGRTMSSGA